MQEARWYVVHTYSGYENKVKADIEKTIENRKLQDQILEVSIPLEEVEEIKNGKIEISLKKMFPGYVFVHMLMNDNTWYVVRNTRGVTGFVGPGSKPVPLSEDEVKAFGLKVDRARETILDFEKGDIVTVVAGAWIGRESVVYDINLETRTVTIQVEMFNGRETSVEVGLTEVVKK